MAGLKHIDTFRDGSTGAGFLDFWTNGWASNALGANFLRDKPGYKAGQFEAGAIAVIALLGVGLPSVAQSLEVCPGAEAGAAEGVVDSSAASSLQGFRLSQQLAAEEAAGASAPTSITSYSAHALDQIAGRDAGIGVTQSALEDAFANPNAIQYAPSAYGPTFRFVGNDATVVVNPQGNVFTGWATSRVGVGP